jgi:2'-5' RNA ligase
LSKAWDFNVTEEILRAYGDVVKNSIQEVMTAVSQARQDGIEVDVTGMDEFDIQSFSADVQDAASVLALQIPSETVRKQLYKRVAFKYLSDARQGIKTQIADEIDAAK